MTRYILIDNHSGYIWGDQHAQSPADAARIIDESENSEYGRVYSEESSGYRPFANATAYHVYVADAAFPEVTDGQDRAMIDAVERDCRKIAVVTIDEDADARDDEPADLYAAFEAE